MRFGGFQPVSLSDYPGKVASVVFTQGCNFACPYCHNRSLVRSFATEGGPSVEEILTLLKDRTKIVDALVVSGGEPTIHADLPAFLKTVKERLGLAVKLDTNGSNPDMLGEILDAGLVDYVAMDLKAPLGKYEMVAGRPVSTDAISRSIELLQLEGVSHELRTTIVSPLLGFADLLHMGCELAGGSKIVLQPFMAREGAPPWLVPFSPAQMEEIRCILADRKVRCELRRS